MVCSQTVQCMGSQINVLKLMCLKTVYRNIGPRCAKVLHGLLKPYTLSSSNEPQLLIELHAAFSTKAMFSTLTHKQLIFQNVFDPKDL